MGNRYLKSEIETLKQMYATATKAEIMVELPGRDWTAISKLARYKLGLHRTRKAKGEAVRLGRGKVKAEREEGRGN